MLPSWKKQITHQKAWKCLCHDLHYNWLTLTGHIGLAVPDVGKACERFEKLGVTFVKKPSDGNDAFFFSSEAIKSYLVEETGYESRQTSKTELSVLFFRMSRDFDGAHEISL